MSEQTSKQAPLTIQSVRDIITKEHDVLLDKNDPILMAVTMHRAALDEYDRLLKLHEQQLSEDMASHVSVFAGEIRKSTNSLLSKAVKTNIDNCLSIINAHQAQMERFLCTLKSMAILAGVFFVLSIAVSISVIVWGV
ncbi:hypothetical protein [Maridesulfovibrio hydrothermalis]|uniref:Transcriptional activator TraM n=1 Tax=Maridesulfovibrio hydrothermalis AM13 = DSM 14728 TaxID=1121451 RepID=L0RB80_9BACT|nr:hypothetical protein [Maridesulfovibrio hydrothermalis]CCO24009.1 conserved protein of unknown function [Maridesulfovibrio hydrothermalis AM13 = DSM 14728]